MNKIFQKLTVPQILVFSFVAVIVVGTTLLMLPCSTTKDINLLEALFTSVSATCVTGLMVVSAANGFTLFGQIIILVLIQIGGLGLMTFVSLFISMFFKNLGLKERIFLKDSLSKLDLSDVKHFLFIVVKYTFVLEILGFIILSTQLYDGSFYSVFQSLFLSVSSFCNAGIDILGNNSLIDYSTNVVINMTVEALIILGGIGFIVIFDISNKLKTHKKLTVHSKIVILTTVFLVLSGFLFIAFLEWNNILAEYSFFEKLNISLFNSVTLRTAGFSTMNYSALRVPTKIIMIAYMLIGASPGGTGGGMKTTVFFLLIFAIYSQYKGSKSVSLFKHNIKPESIIKAGSIFSLYLICIMAGMIILTSVESFSSIDLLFEIVSAIGTVGLSTGITSSLGALSKMVIIISMFIGRLGPITLALSLAKNNKSTIKYPETEILIG